ncbi:hypothetical protein MAPG_00949 [Magnaporthiopsis poae ATCC 64411]|uniref:Uncharacterized protein n=1 Tax=Magnaporthiopsis poae (strain ATCC 64411 / 73-15) TaxID=644358 RepID=A0A0C4DME3_MAGP6|nr:hypothetical protein MAPG_00949 [Magnaporthiopsis poae ATCC 64411]
MGERLARLKRVPFHTEESMSGQPRYSWDDLRKPLLRKSPFEFRDYEAPEGLFYWAAQREFQNAAILQMMEASVSDRRDKGPSVRIFDNPKNSTEAIENIFAFSGEALQQPRAPGDYFNDYHLPPHRQVMATLVIEKRRRERPFPGREYFAIVYEYVGEDELDDEEGSEDRRAVNRKRIAVS